VLLPRRAKRTAAQHDPEVLLLLPRCPVAAV